VWRDGGYQGLIEAIQQGAPRARGEVSAPPVVAPGDPAIAHLAQNNRTKPGVHARVAHPFRILKRVFFDTSSACTSTANAWPCSGRRCPEPLGR
jgi:hypothetical protein